MQDSTLRKAENKARSPITMLCQVAECKLNVAPDWCSFIVSILYNPWKCTIFHQKGSAAFGPCDCKNLIIRLPSKQKICFIICH